jgi:hypothetical protein
MNTWFRKVGMGALALTLAGVLGGCNNGDGGGGGLVRLFFGINGEGNCTQVIVDVNLDDADATIARDGDGEVQCVIADALDDAGCDITFTEFENGDLRAIISGCDIPAVAGLFSCLFEDVDISELQDTASAQCSCVQEGCDENPPVCISLDDDPESCEDCDNGIDDDDNGFEDCDDPNCRNAPECSGTSTTSTTSTTVTVDTTTTTNTTSTTVTTTTTNTQPEFNCTVIFRLADDVTLGSLQYEADYGNAPGEFLGQGGQVECASLVQDSVPAFNDCDTAACPDFATKEEVLVSGIISVDGYTGPLNLAECTFRADIAPVAGDFQITVIEASDPDLNLISPLPDVVIGDISCEGGPTTTLVGPTTTTLVGPTTTTLVGPTTTVDGGDVVNYVLTFQLDSVEGDALVGALQWTTDYTAATGSILGSGATSSCAKLPAIDALFAENDKDRVCSGDEDVVCDADDDCTGVGTCTVDLEQVNLGLVSVDGFSAPADLVTCTFVGTAGDPPVPGDFVITIEDQTDPLGDPITAVVSVEITPAP